MHHNRKEILCGGVADPVGALRPVAGQKRQCWGGFRMAANRPYKLLKRNGKIGSLSDKIIGFATMNRLLLRPN
jgi:hypothetical protein